MVGIMEYPWADLIIGLLSDGLEKREQFGRAHTVNFTALSSLAVCSSNRFWICSDSLHSQIS